MIDTVRAYLNRIVDNFGFHFALTLISIYGGLGGIVYRLRNNAMLPYFRNMRVTGERYQSFGTVADTPWAMKAAIGLLSDAVPLLGYHKRTYIVLVSVLGALCLAILGFVPLPPALAPLAALLLLLVELQAATVDLLTEGKYAELMVKHPETGSDLVSFVRILVATGTFLGSIVSGPVADHSRARYIFVIAFPIAFQVVLPVLLGWFPEQRLPPPQRRIHTHKLSAYPKLVKLSVAMTTGAIIVGMSGLASGSIQSILSVTVALTLALLGFIWLPHTLRRANLYMFLNKMLYLTINGATDYWFIAKEECVPGGPKFSYTYYTTYTNLVGSMAAIAGVAIFQRFLSRGGLRIAFVSTATVKLIASLFDIAIVLRYNKRLGIPDRWFFMMGDAIIVQAVTMLDNMPAIVLTSKVCPHGMEASVYAILASYQNLGESVARTLGVGLIEYMGIRTTLPCNFERLPLLIGLAHFALPALTIPLVFGLIPKANMTDDLVGELVEGFGVPPDEASEGSEWLERHEGEEEEEDGDGCCAAGHEETEEEQLLKGDGESVGNMMGNNATAVDQAEGSGETAAGRKKREDGEDVGELIGDGDVDRTQGMIHSPVENDPRVER